MTTHLVITSIGVNMYYGLGKKRDMNLGSLIKHY